MSLADEERTRTMKDMWLTSDRPTSHGMKR